MGINSIAIDFFLDEEESPFYKKRRNIFRELVIFGQSSCIISLASG
jgi:hypothetical protein